MDAPRIVPAVSPAEAEDFYTTGTAAYPAQQPQANPDQQVRIDVPGCGMVDALGLPAMLIPVDDAVNEKYRHHLAQLHGGMETVQSAAAEAQLQMDLHANAKAQASLAGHAKKAAVDALVCELIFAARILAEKQIATREQWQDEPGPFRFCRECLVGTLSGNSIPHASGCCVGRVLRLLDAMIGAQELPANAQMGIDDVQRFGTQAVQR